MAHDIKHAIDAAAHYERTGVLPTWARVSLTSLFRDHGQALVEAVKDAERYKYVRDSKGMKGFWICHGIFGEGASRWTGEHADRQIDLARTKAGVGGGS